MSHSVSGQHSQDGRDGKARIGSAALRTARVLVWLSRVGFCMIIETLGPCPFSTTNASEQQYDIRLKQPSLRSRHETGSGPRGDPRPTGWEEPRLGHSRRSAELPLACQHKAPAVQRAAHASVVDGQEARMKRRPSQDQAAGSLRRIAKGRTQDPWFPNPAKRPQSRLPATQGELGGIEPK
jgi:hypothetical protein